MNNIHIIYRILKAIDASLDYDEFDDNLISVGTLGTTDNRRAFILQMLSDEGLIEITKSRPLLTLKGVEYFAEKQIHYRSEMGGFLLPTFRR